MKQQLYRLLFFLSFFLLSGLTWSQVTLEVEITGATANSSCDDVFSGPEIQWSAEVQFNGWVTYPQTGGCFSNPPNVQYSETFECASDLPQNINVCFRVFENDPFLPCDINAECEESICMDFPVPANPGTVVETLSLPGGLSSSGTLNFNITRSGMGIDAPNNALCDAIDLGLLEPGVTLGNSALSNYNNHCADGLNEPNPGDEGANWNNNVGVWFSFTTGNDFLPYVDVEVLSDPQNLGDPVNLQVALYASTDGTCTGPMNLIQANYSNVNYDEVFQVNCLQPNTTYFFLVDGANFSSEQNVGLFGLSFAAFDVLEAADLKCDAEDLGTVPDGGSVSTPGPRSNECATNTGDPFVPAFVSQKSVWFFFTPPLSGHVLVEAVSDPGPPAGYNSVDLQLAVYRSNTNTCTGFFFHQGSVYTGADNDESLELSCLDPTRPYWILVDGAGNDTEGIFEITITDLGDDTPVTNLDITLCAGEDFTVGSSTYDMTGMYSDTLSLPGGCDSIVNTNLLVLDPVEASVDITTYATDVGQPDGAALGSAIGGSGNYTYSWSNGQMTAAATGLIGDDLYCLTVTDDQGCTDDTCFVMPYSTVPVPTLTGDALLCFGDTDGSIGLTVVAGQPPYTYNWENASATLTGTGTIAMDGGSDTVTGLPAGDYSFTITDGINDTMVTVAITQPTELGVQFIDQQNASCFGECDGSLMVNAMGGTPPYIFAWSSGASNPDITGLCADDYSVTITDANGCNASATYSISQPPEFIATATVLNDVSCFNGADASIQVTTNGNPTDYDWSNGGTTDVLTDLSAGIYSVVVTNDDGCQATADVTVTEPSAPVSVSINVLEEVTCFGGTNAVLQAVPGGPGNQFFYTWTGAAATTATAANLGAGNYSVTVANELGCEATANVTLDEPSEIIPQLATTDITCVTAADAGAVAVTDITGGLEPYVFSVDGDVFTTDTLLGNLTEGFYQLYVEDAGGCLRTFDFEIAGPPEFSVDLGSDQTLDLGETLTLDAVAPGSDLVYTWLTEGMYECQSPTCAAIELQPLGDLSVSVQVLDTLNLCTAEDQVRITVNRNLRVFAPNAFSPDADGINDVFVLYGDEVINRIVTLQVFDRFGSLVHQADDFMAGDESNGWDGRVGGQAAQTGVYVYFAEVEFIDGTTEVVKGDLLLIR